MKNQLIPSVAAVAIKDGKILLVRHGEAASHLIAKYALPGGRLTPGETELDAVVRKFKEETGLTAERRDFQEFPDNFYTAKIPKKNGEEEKFGWTVFKVKKFKGELKDGNGTTPEWIEIGMLSAFEEEGKLLPNTILAIKAANSA